MDDLYFNGFYSDLFSVLVDHPCALSLMALLTAEAIR